MKENASKLKRSLLVSALLLSTFVVVAVVIGGMTGLAAGSGESTQASNGWDTVFTETFESGIDPAWTLSDENGGTDGEYFWGTTTYTASEGTQSAWATGGADGASLTPGSDPYPPNALSHMIRGPLNLSGTTQIELDFSYWVKTEPTVDVMVVRASTDGSTYTALNTYSGDSDGWKSDTLSLDEYAGEEEVWIDFFFSSNGADGDVGVFVDDITLRSLAEQLSYLPFVRRDPTPTPTSTPTPTPTPTTPPYYYYDDFSDANSGWPSVDNTHVSNDCFKWFYGGGHYNATICDDRTDVKVSPLVPLPDGDYEIEVDAHFREAGGWWTSYGIIFDGKDDPDPDNPDLGDYNMLWVLWEGSKSHKWTLLRDVPGKQINVTGWQSLSPSYYNYGDHGLAWNTWRIVRTDDQVTFYVNDHKLRDMSESRPTTNYQILFGVYASTYETGSLKASFDNYLINALDGSGLTWQGTPQPFYSSGSMEELEQLLPHRND